MSGEVIFDFCCFIYFLCFFCKCHSQCLKNLETWQFKCYFSFIYIFCSSLVLFRYVWMANKYTRKLLRFICMYMDVYLTISLFMLVCIIKKIFNSLHQNDNNPHYFILSAIDTTPNMHQKGVFCVIRCRYVFDFKTPTNLLTGLFSCFLDNMSNVSWLRGC